ncbi:MAG: ATP-dependent DNA helicase [Clostridia bacterium]|nr:ATP-dependent DNA helicase [Clostridia bacterium]
MDICVNDSGVVTISSDTLASFARQRIRRDTVTCYPSSDPYGDADVFSDLSLTMIKGGEVFKVTGEADGIYSVGGEYTVEMKKQVKRISSSSDPSSDPHFLAKAYVTAYLVCKNKMKDRVTLKITLCADNGSRSFDIPLTTQFLARITESLLERAAYFATVKKNFCIRGKQDLANMPFPHSSIREGQEEFVKEAYRAIRNGSRLLVCAPTGIGKTVSALFPSLKALGEGLCDKIFYFTAKTVTGTAAARCADSVVRFCPDLRTVTVTAKERVCPAKNKKYPFVWNDGCFTCPLTHEADGVDYSQRRDAAMRDLLSSKNTYGKDDIEDAAKKHGICPYELSLDLSEYCQVVICDYNYAIDPKVRFRRYFEDAKEKYVFLFDEAHNLPDRARETFSASIDSDSAAAFCEKLEKYCPEKRELISKTNALLSALDSVRALTKEDSALEGDDEIGYYTGNVIPKELLSSASELNGAISSAKDDLAASIGEEEIDSLSSALSDLVFLKDFFDEKFVFFVSSKNGSTTAKIICLDPSDVIDGAMRKASSVILFSATLSPIDYYAEVCGCGGAKTLELDSPFDSDNLCVAVVSSVSTKYSVRRDTAYRVAETICAAVSPRNGHYIVYFPSYRYMNTVYEEFRKIAPGNVSALVQKAGMSVDARRQFLSFFEGSDTSRTLVGFCVLGGVFSEGIDLPDEKLIGAILVGLGLPGISSELNILKEYYDRTREEGFNFAYLYPAIVKTSQAAGRVIRGEDDRGILVLIDERYEDPSILKLLPRNWKNIHVAGDPASLAGYLEKFWTE